MFKLFRKTLSLVLAGLLLSFSLAAQADTMNALFRQANDPVAGNPRGTITVVEFFDYQCSHCINMAPTVSTIIKDNPDVRVVFKDLPIRGPISEFAARAALAARLQGKYYPFNHALLSASEPLTEQSIMDIARNTGLNVQKLKKDMGSSTITAHINATMMLAKELQLSGTPAFFIGKTNAQSKNDVTFVLGEMSQSELQNAINQAKS